MPEYNVIAETNKNTVVTDYKPVKKNATDYQTEAELEAEFIKMLGEQGYTRLKINSEEELISNLRKKLEELNKYRFSDSEWKTFFKKFIANPNESVAAKTYTIQEDYIKNLTRDDGTTKNIMLIDKDNIHNNCLQVINQYEVDQEKGAKYNNRYDVTVLVNGLPLVHIELKRRGINIREAFNQIARYKRDSFSAGYGLFKYIQIFVISNGTNTKYYSNTTRPSKNKVKNSFEFTSYWADANNVIIPDLIDFTKTFFSKHTILNILTKYCIFTTEKILMVMRPYQIIATERILNRIQLAYNTKAAGSKKAGGYIWHTTGSGKTMTSFKTARLASKLDYIDKVLFVVDRKDLDYQTMQEYDRFEKGAADSNTSTAILQRQLEDPNTKIIITTIQKLANFIKKNTVAEKKDKENKITVSKGKKGHAFFNKNVVIIFDECHRSQFGDMHRAITKNFKNYYLFGFTGTPIFAVNSNVGTKSNLFTTEGTFGDQLHTYTIVDAINDKNVLPFRVDYIKTMSEDEDITDEQVWTINREKAMEAPERISLITKYILDHFNQKTYQNCTNESYDFNVLKNVEEVAAFRPKLVKKQKSDVSALDKTKSMGQSTVGEINSGNSYDTHKYEFIQAVEKKQKEKLVGFNSLFAVASVPMAKLYYEEFKKQLAAIPNKKLRIATIFSYAPNEDVADDNVGEENSESTSALDKPSRDFLEEAIKDYNNMFGTSYDTSSEKFQNYYRDVSHRMKNKELDILIVVNMFLTGFNAPTLNTLWVDKNLKMHGLIQAFSRTNRILNSIKDYGNIVCFRNLQKRVDSAIALFGDKDAGGVVLVREFKDYYYGYKANDGKKVRGYVELVAELRQKFPLSLPRIIGEQNQKDFIVLFGSILRMTNLLKSFDQFENKQLFFTREFQDYSGRYQDLRDEWAKKPKHSTDITNDVVFEVELINQVDITIDYILMLVKKYHDTHCEDKEIEISIDKAIYSSPELRSKKELIKNFISYVDAGADIISEWQEYVTKQRNTDLANIIAEEKLKPKETYKFMANAFRDGEVKTVGTEIDKLMPAMSRFTVGNKRVEKKLGIIEKFYAFFEKYFGIGGSSSFEETYTSVEEMNQPLQKVANTEEQDNYGPKKD